MDCGAGVDKLLVRAPGLPLRSPLPSGVALLLAVVLAVSCGSARKLEQVRSVQARAGLRLAREGGRTQGRPAAAPHRDTLRVVDFEGRQMFIMNAVRDDESGEMVATEQLEAARVTALSTRAAERHGRIDLEFQVIVPRSMQDRSWQLRFYPDMYVMEDTVRLETVVITGDGYRRAQLRGYQQYERFLSSIISDTTRFINMWQLELFLERNIPEVYRFKQDSTLVSDSLFYSHYGATQREAVDHYTRTFSKRLNEHRKSLRGRMYRKYVKSPIVTEGIRLDTVLLNQDGEFVYNYVQSINTRKGLRKVQIVLSGDIWDGPERIYAMPPSDTLTFYVSSVASLADTSTRYRTRIVERRVDANTSCQLQFACGRSEVNPSLGDNARALSRIRGIVGRLLDNKEFDLDSISVVSYASPEGSAKSNDALSRRRSESISRCLDGFVRTIRDSLDAEAGFFVAEDGTVSGPERVELPFRSRSGGENWSMVDLLVRLDTVLTDAQKEEYESLRGIPNADARDRQMASRPWYRRLKDGIYPQTRIVSFDFHLHRKGMVKDTVHTTEIDSVYMAGVRAIDDRDYETAASLLMPYADYNAAVAYVALDRNVSAMSILSELPPTPAVNYMLAILYSRRGDDEQAVQHYLWACGADPSLEWRGNLDPEIAELKRRYEINEE